MSRTWTYEDRDGRLLGSVKRIDEPGGGKRFVQRKADGKPGGFGHYLYGLQRLTEPGRAVHILEGEKAADAAYAAGLVAVSTCGGAGAAHLADLDPLDGFKFVIILPDNDKPSRQRWAPALIKKLAALPQPPRVLVCELPDLPEKGDIVDWLQARLPNWDGYDLVNAPKPLAEQLRDTIKANVTPAEEWASHAIEVIDGGAGWQEPEELPSLVAPVLELDPELLPEKLRQWAEIGAENLQCPLDYIAAAAMVEASILIGRKVTIRPKRCEPWNVVPNLWGSIIGPPSAKKSPAIKFALRPIRQLQREAMERFAEEQRQHQQDCTLARAEIDQRKKDLQGAVKNKDAPLAEQLSREIVELEEQLTGPQPREYYTSDTTPEKLAMLLQENPVGLLQQRDELMGWLRGLDRAGREQERPFYLEAWDGDGSYIVHRVTRDSVYLEGMCVSVFGGIQPGPTAKYVADATSGGVRDDGMLQRFQLTVWPDLVNGWKYVDKTLDSTLYATAESVFRRLDKLTAESVGATIPEDGLPFLRFDDEAQQLFIEWLTALNTEKMRPDEHPAMQAHLAKYESLMPSLALILHLADGFSGPVSAAAAAKAADWCDYLESHARRLYGSQIQEEASTARLLADKILAGKVEDGSPTWKIPRNCWSGLDKDATDRAMRVLEEHGWLRVERVPTDGKPKQIIRLNPNLALQA